MLTVSVRAFEAADADVHAELARRAYAAVRDGERPRESPARRAHLHGDANPAGRAAVAVASLDGRVVGQASGSPARFIAGDGRACTGWQVGGFVVDPGVQRQGVGRALVAELTRELAARTAGFVYTFPNPRSRPLFERHGYAHAATIPTRVVVSRRDRAAEVIGAQEARALVASIRVERGPGFVRDADGFAWRFLADAVAGDYRFARIADPAHGEHVVAAARHRWRGLAFAVLADAFPALTARTLPLAVRGAAVAGDSALVYVTTNLPAVGSGITALGTRIPARFDPRPVELLVLPGGAVDPAEVAAAPILTADWMGF